MAELILTGTTLKNSECCRVFSGCTTKIRYSPYGITGFEYCSVRVSDQNVRITESFNGENGVFASKIYEEKPKESRAWIA